MGEWYPGSCKTLGWLVMGVVNVREKYAAVLWHDWNFDELCVGQIGRAMGGWVAAWTLSLHTSKGELEHCWQPAVAAYPRSGFWCYCIAVWALAGCAMDGERLGSCRTLGRLCGLWTCVRIRYNCAVRLGLSQSCVQTRSTVRWMAGWLPAK